jgi:hypothetical protein
LNGKPDNISLFCDSVWKLADITGMFFCVNFVLNVSFASSKYILSFTISDFDTVLNTRWHILQAQLVEVEPIFARTMLWVLIVPSYILPLISLSRLSLHLQTTWVLWLSFILPHVRLTHMCPVLLCVCVSSFFTMSSFSWVLSSLLVALVFTVAMRIMCSVINFSIGWKLYTCSQCEVNTKCM